MCMCTNVYLSGRVLRNHTLYILAVILLQFAEMVSAGSPMSNKIMSHDPKTNDFIVGASI